MIEEILPPAVTAVEAFADGAEAPLYPQEEAVIARAVERRRQEFATVRACARSALAQLGVAPGPIVPGPRGAPQWPAGIVGSMTHCAGYRAAAVARAAQVTAIGVDAEPHDALPDGVLDHIAGPAEQDRLAQLAAAGPDVHWDRLLFSAKESVYKAWFPLTGRWLGFEEADVTIGPDGTFGARLLAEGPVLAGGPLAGFNGRWLVRDGFIVTAVAVLPGG